MTKSEHLQQVWRYYEDRHENKPTSARQAVEWAVHEGLLELPSIDPYDVLAGDMAQALREETDTDENGRKYRVNHAARVTKGGVQYTFWARMGYAPHEHMEIAFGQRREQVIGDLMQLKTDVDVYNNMNKGKRPAVQLPLDFTDDVAERMIQAELKKKVKSEVA